MGKPNKKFKKTLGNEVVLDFDAEPGHGEHVYLDTKVSVNGVTLCWISYPELAKFMGELDAVIEKYRI